MNKVAEAEMNTVAEVTPATQHQPAPYTVADFNRDAPALLLSANKFTRKAMRLSHLGDMTHDIEEIAFKALHNFYRKVESGEFRGDSAASTYLNRVVVNTVKNFIASINTANGKGRRATDSVDAKGDETGETGSEVLARLSSANHTVRNSSSLWNAKAAAEPSPVVYLVGEAPKPLSHSGKRWDDLLEDYVSDEEGSEASGKRAKPITKYTTNAAPHSANYDYQVSGGDVLSGLINDEEETIRAMAFQLAMDRLVEKDAGRATMLQTYLNTIFNAAETAKIIGKAASTVKDHLGKVVELNKDGELPAAPVTPKGRVKMASTLASFQTEVFAIRKVLENIRYKGATLPALRCITLNDIRPFLISTK